MGVLVIKRGLVVEEESITIKVRAKFNTKVYKS